ncbi:DUF5803 family protein [Candidatus Halobonum tyrrellensis]|uniref:Lipoprotein n=1 Tax=Candidatus Halobonum tyrrellensis G22 TaxID=1324957 RepID=V4GSJ3_9EURY|nr:DUF5803 family protein [Candidatus Halobonum tyrrellensis]ESP88061.1 hypothetical protein K933_10944 [Candidatus Halobonum tyrrellensis G22]
MSRRNRVLAVVALVGLLGLSGCLGLFGGGSVGDDRLDRAPAGDDYAWNASVDAHITVLSDATFEAVYRVNGSEATLYRPDGLGGRTPLDVRAVRYQYPNGTVINGSTLAARGGVTQNRDEVTVTLPADVEGGRLAFTAGSTPKRFSLPTYVDGSYEVVLPPGRDVSLPVFGQISPGDYDTPVRTDDRDRVHITWGDVTADSVTVQFYQPGDLRILGGLVALAGVVGVGGLLYYRRQIERLRRLREEHGLDVDTDDDDRQGPPPGMG